MKPKDYIIRIAKHAYRAATRKKFYGPKCEMNRTASNDIILKLLSGNEPCMISRFGTVELNCVNNYLCVVSNRKFGLKVLDYVTDHTHTPWWNEEHFKILNVSAGVFPPGEDTSRRFAEKYLNDIPLIDVLGSFQYFEKYMPIRGGAKRLHFETLYPFFVANPWTQALAGKKVLVVHPFDYSIREQYKKRSQLFENKNTLPEFELITYRSVQSAAGMKVEYSDWFEALSVMQDEIAEMDFDICIIGCGAYGLPLAAHVKRLGKKAIHLGGGVQLLFGIKGKRWEEQYEKEWHYRPGETIGINYASLFNEYWVNPDISERPPGALSVENGCYW
jgi:hypothetical protein